MIRPLALTAVALSLACSSQPAAEAASADAPKAAVEEAPKAVEVAKKPVVELSVDELSKLMTEKAKVAVIDANGQDTREKSGVIPGATLLTSYREFDPSAELPSDKDTKLVFYCGSTSCSASDTAAEQAQTAGFNDVNVLRAGIKGWKAAGKETVALATLTKAAKGG